MFLHFQHCHKFWGEFVIPSLLTLCFFGLEQMDALNFFPFLFYIFFKLIYGKFQICTKVYVYETLVYLLLSFSS